MYYFHLVAGVVIDVTASLMRHEAMPAWQNSSPTGTNGVAIRHEIDRIMLMAGATIASRNATPCARK